MSYSGEIVLCKIHPAIGIARVGNSPEKYFIGPEMPGPVVPPPGGYKDDGDPQTGAPPRIKRQGARFRIFGYNADGKVVRELSASDADITWIVYLANKKAAWHRFRGRTGEDRPEAPLRNKDIQGLEERAALVIDPGPREVIRRGDSAKFTGGTFMGIPVPLGEIRADRDGRLLVLGGFGRSGTADPTKRIGNYANNNRWYDDVSDGPVRAKVKLKGEAQDIPVIPAWVIVAPPDFAPGVPNVVTLYDVTLDVARFSEKVKAELKKPILDAVEQPSFTHHIYPILVRVSLHQWVSRDALRGHGPNPKRGFDLTNTETFIALSSNLPEHAPKRHQVFAILRDPYLLEKFRKSPDMLTPEEREKAVEQAQAKFMPPLSGDDGDAITGEPGRWFAVTKTQYDMMRNWAQGQFIADWQEPPSTPPSRPDPSPADLDRAALEATSGGAFYPGIEAGWVMRNPAMYRSDDPFRFDQDELRLQAGDITKRMACPWQADFFECQVHWWPAQRPDDVLTLETFSRLREIEDEIGKLAPENPDNQEQINALRAEQDELWRQRAAWARGLPAESYAGDEEMVKSWYHLGFVVDRGENGAPFVIGGRPQYVETERNKYVLSMAEYFHILVNIEDYPDFWSRAKELARQMLDDAKFNREPNYAQFYYTPKAFDERMDKIYDDFVADMNRPHRFDSGVISWPAVVDFDADGDPVIQDRRFNVKRFSNLAVRERIRQLAPFNLVDGAWLQNILSTGPANEVQARLFAIWQDEAGNGETELNHCNVYDTLLKSLNIYLPPITSREFIEENFVPSAFEGAVFQLCVGLFPQDFFPELLGMTLYLEWEATPTLTPTVRMLDGRRINPHFYRLHVAIDNISVGHGALIKEAIKLYLEAKREEGGDKAVQEHWERIWRGYVAWATLGNSADEVLERMMLIDRKQIYIGPSLLRPADIRPPFVQRLRTEPRDPVSAYLWSRIRPETQALIMQQEVEKPLAPALLGALRDDLNRLLKGPSLYDEERFAKVLLSEQTKYLLGQNPQGLDLIDLNRWLLEDAYPSGVARKQPFPDLKEYYKKRMLDLIRRKARAARTAHGSKVLVDQTNPEISWPLGTLFDAPEQLLEALLKSGLINVRNPRKSEFFEKMEFSGPMYKVFTEEEKQVILDWIEALREEGVTVVPPEVTPSYPADAALAMRKVVRRYQERAKGVQAHGRYQLKNQAGVTKSILEWLDESPEDVMEALANTPAWVKPGSAVESRFVTEILAPTGPMGGVFEPHELDIIKKWIDEGAKVPAKQGEFMAIQAISPAPVPEVPVTVEQTFAERRQRIGMGSVH